MPIEEQVVSIFAGTNGFLDDLPVANVSRFEAELLEDVRSRRRPLLDRIRAGGDLPETELKEAVTDFKDRFQPSERPAAAAAAATG
jgi:F-type H+-transporting ATPase subunit alpha